MELDFSRKGQKGTRSIATSLTCCQNCSVVFSDLFVNFLICKKGQPVVDFHGRLVRRHQPLPDWSLTSYLKALHTASMSWEAIYWHVYGICTVFRVNDITFSASDSFRYTLDSDGISIIPSRYPIHISFISCVDTTSSLSNYNICEL